MNNDEFLRGLQDRVEQSPTSERCPECGNPITEGAEGTEYGHERGKGGGADSERCPRRPESVDPGRPSPEVATDGGQTDE